MHNPYDMISTRHDVKGTTLVLELLIAREEIKPREDANKHNNLEHLNAALELNTRVLAHLDKTIGL